jgi:hypothetical protein
MKLTMIAAALSLVLSNAFAHNHEEGKKKMGHDKEHTHVEGASMDHEHDEGHHGDHDHEAHHPGHKDEAKKVAPQKKK